MRKERENPGCCKKDGFLMVFGKINRKRKRPPRNSRCKKKIRRKQAISVYTIAKRPSWKILLIVRITDVYKDDFCIHR